MKQIQQDIKDGNIKSLYLLYGEEDFLRQRMKNQLKEALVGDAQSMNFAYYEGKNVEAKEVIEFADTLPFLAQRRLVIVENSNLNQKAPDEWLDYLSHIAPTTCLVLVEKEIDKRSRFYKACKKYGYTADLDMQKEQVLVQWVKAWLNENHCQMTDAAIHYFLERVSNNMGIIQNELEKLYCYDMQDTNITVERIQKITAETIENKIFAMIEAAFKADTKKAFDLYYDLVALKEAPMKILVLLTRQINILLQIKDHLRLRHANAEIARAVGVAPFVIGKNAAVARQLPYKKLMDLLKIAVQLDEDIKMGRIKDGVAVEILLTKCCS